MTSFLSTETTVHSFIVDESVFASEPDGNRSNLPHKGHSITPETCPSDSPPVFSNPSNSAKERVPGSSNVKPRCLRLPIIPEFQDEAETTTHVHSNTATTELKLPKGFPKPNYYSILALPLLTPTHAQIRQSYKRQILLHHPDKIGRAHV